MGGLGMRNCADWVCRTSTRPLLPGSGRRTGAWLAMWQCSRLSPTLSSTRSAFLDWRHRQPLNPIEPPWYGPVCPVVWEGRSREAPPYPDQAAVVNVIEPIFARDFAEQSYGFRPGRGCKDALRRVDGLLKAGYVHVVDADLKGYFDSIPHDPLMRRLREKIADGPVLSLIESFLKARIMDGLEEWTPASGAPQGAVLNPLLSNIYLD